MITKVLYVGDVHLTLDALDEGERLLQGVRDTAADRSLKRIVFLGDQYHTHSVMRVEILEFWRRWFAKLASVAEVIALVGNHDQATNRVGHAMMAHADAITVIDKPVERHGLLYVPYLADPAEVTAVSQRYPKTGCMVAHQTFDGATYENGFYAKEAVPMQGLCQPAIISGHIHKPQQIGPVIYPGSPRWRILTDAGDDRALSVIGHAEDGRVVSHELVPTDRWCRRIVHLEDRPDTPADLASVPKGADLRIDAWGPEAHLAKRAPELRAWGARVRTFRTDAPMPKVRESAGVGVAFRTFRAGFQPPHGTPTAFLTERTTHLEQVNG